MSFKHWLAVAILATGLLSGATASTVSAAGGVPVVKKSTMAPGNTPVDVYMTGLPNRTATAVVLAHGFGSAQQIMADLAEAIARKGFVAVTFDFSGHGRNPNTFDEADPFPQFTADLDHVVEFALTLSGIEHVALLGHSAGANTVVPYALSHGDIVATIELSGNTTEIMPDSPHNLLLLVGSAEEQSVLDDYNDALANAGTPSSSPLDFVAGRARAGILIPDADHTSILFAPATLAAVGDWLDGLSAASRVTRSRLKP
jgi:pimeloyl-ACP methyl ester carboxylesterase